MNQEQIIRALDAVAKTDAQVAEGLTLVGYPPPRNRPPGFQALLEIIANQQISKEAAAAILQRLNALMETPTAQAFAACSDEALQTAGLSRPKIAYARGVADAILTGALPIDRFPEMPDAEVLDALIALKGIGRWSAEIYCMFSLGRADLFPGEDIALQEAMKRLKRLAERPKPKLARNLAADWAPHRTAMSVFLWKYYRGAPAEIATPQSED